VEGTDGWNAEEISGYRVEGVLEVVLLGCSLDEERDGNSGRG
jgi:hypothetical protein